jgi:hypothetical protein
MILKQKLKVLIIIKAYDYLGIIFMYTHNLAVSKYFHEKANKAILEPKES